MSEKPEKQQGAKEELDSKLEKPAEKQVTENVTPEPKSNEGKKTTKRKNDYYS
ncbi:MAG: hypothetical protein LRY73_13300 [Bacillus sp. (in: Bacteria)]|nr:hypothetical protein [Bacillus sp. (in: firmicutes)]